MHKVAFAAAIVVLVSVTAALACGTERWAVKVGTDPDATNVANEPKATTIAALTSIEAPGRPNSQPRSRFAPTELTVYQITGVLAVIKKEKDEDYHLVITGADNPNVTMIVESPEPRCAIGSAFADNIGFVRNQLDQKFGDFRRLEPNLPVTVTGVAFFDPIHGQEGVAPNGIELHPILNIQFQAVQ